MQFSFFWQEFRQFTLQIAVVFFVFSFRMVNTGIFLWCAPRCVATAVERSVRTLGNGQVFHEPFLTLFYYSPEKKSSRPACAESLQAFSRSSYQSVCKMLQQDFDSKEFVFVKDMAYCVEGKFDIFLEEGFRNFKHTFMIRHPKPAVSSLFRLSTNPELAGWDYFDPAEAGFRQLLELYEFVDRHVHKNPVVVDAADLLKFPNDIMQSYCEAVGLKYEKHMTSWQPGPVADWGPCTAWHDEVMKSSGFIAPGAPSTVKDMPPEVATVVKECMPYYEALAARRILPKAH